ncbi:class I SAM-dependent methyltransferase [Amycolatopsis magusensis]|uniref:Ubiquinone/menaquinone biosynthesis C-methylase UbiE n=1 Tax=Amycolatopsis magusensis TaxID=882444 RepID=A0ABS4PIS7_9PSEU|nr:methyltransferase domain-containing protein [Amycolatopsis magusensis]MBP2178820.1 ubiquinone/menaquinone biosynthesis C-methylase UbiE [Amycolatopsis magusensis]
MGPAFLFDEQAPAYDANGFHDRVATALVDGLGNTPVQTVLDVATGTGAAAFAALRLLDPESVTALDISGGMITRAQERAAEFDPEGRISWLVAPAVPAPASDVDLVLCASSLHFLGLAAIEDWLRVLKPGGRVAFTLPFAGTFNPSGPIAGHVAADLPIPSDVDEAAAVAAGFADVRVRRWETDGRVVFLVHGRKP